MTHRFVYSAFALMAGLMPLAVQADEMLDRYKAASQAQAEKMAAFMVARVPELEGAMPPTEWTAEADVVGACTVDRIRADRGEEGLEAYVAAVEEMAAAEVTSMAQMAETVPDLMQDPYFMEVAGACGAMELAQKQMEESGMMALLADPSVMQRLSE